MTITLKIEREVEPKEIAYLVFGTGALGYPWWGTVDWGHEEDGEDFPIEQGGDLDTAEEDDYIILQHDARDDDEGDMTGKIRLTFRQIATAAAAAIRKGYVREHDAIHEDLGLCDAEEADTVLQMAVFGELVYG
jgi:hypothetical protein